VCPALADSRHVGGKSTQVVNATRTALGAKNDDPLASDNRYNIGQSSALPFY
jgi:hypothetical protein